MTKHTSDRAAAHRLRERLNMVPNLFWTAVNVTPAAVYWYDRWDVPLFLCFVIVSSAALFLPRSVVNTLQIGDTARPYRRLGVHLVNRVAQNGTWINRRVEKRFPGHSVVTRVASSRSSPIARSYMFERFHWMLFLLFLLTSFRAVAAGEFLWTVVLIITNILYNLYPNLLQQYLRIKLTAAPQR